MQEFYISYFDKENEIIKTRFTDIISENNLKKVSNMLPYLYDLYEEAVDILENGEINNRYHTFYINKKNGKKRRIDTPDEELKNAIKHVSDSLGKEFSSMDDVISFRKEAREAKNWEIADKIRVALDEVNIIVKDSKEGTVWEVK